MTAIYGAELKPRLGITNERFNQMNQQCEFEYYLVGTKNCGFCATCWPDESLRGVAHHEVRVISMFSLLDNRQVEGIRHSGSMYKARGLRPFYLVLSQLGTVVSVPLIWHLLKAYIEIELSSRSNQNNKLTDLPALGALETCEANWSVCGTLQLATNSLFARC